MIVAGVKALAGHGFAIVATGGTADHLRRAGLPVETVNKVGQGRPHIVDRIKDGGVDLIINTTEGWQSLKDSKPIRVAALGGKIPYFTTASAANEAARAIARDRSGAGRDLEVRTLQSYHSPSHD